ncbi:hypothetical protein BH09VER1_BH09VER1_24830 [soil metagenome]
MSDFLQTIPGTNIPLCLVCEDHEATTALSGIGPCCLECHFFALQGQKEAMAFGIGPDVIAGHARNNRRALP